MTKARKCAEETAKFLAKKELTEGVSIYVDHVRYHVNEQGELIYDIDTEAKEYLEYCGDFMSMSFEGPLYDVLNENWRNKTYDKWEQELVALFKKYGKYYELGSAWYLSLYDL